MTSKRFLDFVVPLAGVLFVAGAWQLGMVLFGTEGAIALALMSFMPMNVMMYILAGND